MQTSARVKPSLKQSKMQELQHQEVAVLRLLCSQNAPQSLHLSLGVSYPQTTSDFLNALAHDGFV